MSTIDKNHLINGYFTHNLNGWTAAGGAQYLASDGDEHFGMANLPVGGSISQGFAVEAARSFSLHISAKSPSGALVAGNVTYAITDGNGLSVTSSSLTGALAEWSENLVNIGLADGTTYTLTITNVSAAGDVRIDDVWMWFIPVTRAQIAAQVDNKLGRIADERSLTPTPAGTMTEGSYTYAIDAALRNVGAIDPQTGNPDVRWLNAQSVQLVIDATRREMLEQLQSDYAVEVDTRTGPYQQSLSQKRAAITEMLGGSGETGSNTAGIVVRRMGFDG